MVVPSAKHSGQHGVHGGTDGDRVKKDVPADQMLRPDVDLAVLHGILCTKGGEGFQVLVNRTRAQIAAARAWRPGQQPKRPSNAPRK